ncbi:2-hydroxyacid dehydrogenase [Pedococcus sp. 5OH_020]|uniref:2-hydroxyacid dehydrogenase n=1 Tax=Pedococcus sp. 5OH_020 TaxID=2989814 RepID=UPI0022E9F180|nr:2-hydroxyacid dehydrogenase [Pedococcus sp. 5OH_020]
MPTAWLPYNDPQEALRLVGPPPPGITIDLYHGGPYPQSIDVVTFYVLPYMSGPEVLAPCANMPKLAAVQTLTAGYEQFLPHLPAGVTLCNAAGVHDASTAELAVGLILARGRELDHHARNQSARTWSPGFGTSLADRRVLIIGYGNVGRAIEQRLQGFEPASITRVARTARSGPPHVHAISELHELLPTADVAIVIAPHTPETEGLISSRELALLPDGALLVNVARGRLVDTQALVSELEKGRLSAAVDVVEPEPLPEDHPLWTAPNILITPHVGGMSSAFAPRAGRLIAQQLERLSQGRPLENVVVEATS